MKTILTIECFKDIRNEPTQINKMAYNEINSGGWLYRVIPLPGSIFAYVLNGDCVGSAIDILFDGANSLHEKMQSIIQQKRFAHSEYDGHYIVHLVIDEAYGYDDCEDFTVLGVLDLSKIEAG